MAMPSEIPPPLPDEYRPVFAAAEALATQMAKSVKCGVGDVLRRVKSRNWMVGRLSRQFGGYSNEDLHDVLDELRRLHRPTTPDELEARRVDLTSRRPLVFLEPVAWPAWAPRVELLGALVVYPMTILELTTRARARLGWTANHVKQATAAAEGANELWYDRPFNLWQRTPERILMSDPKKKTQVKRTQRHLPVVLKAEDRSALVDRIRAAKEEWDALMAELNEFKKAQRAKLEAAEARREAAIKAMTTGRETQLVECEERWDYGQRQVVTVRKDTGEVVDTREMTADELQLSMPAAS